MFKSKSTHKVPASWGRYVLQVLVIYNWYVLPYHYNAAIEVRTSSYSQTQEISDCNRQISPLHCYFIKYSNHIFVNKKGDDFIHMCSLYLLFISGVKLVYQHNHCN